MLRRLFRLLIVLGFVFMLGFVVVQASTEPFSLRILSAGDALEAEPGQIMRVEVRLINHNAQPVKHADVLCSWDHRLGRLVDYESGPFRAVLAGSSFVDFGIDHMMPEDTSLMPERTHDLSFSVQMAPDVTPALHSDAIHCTLYTNISVEMAHTSADLAIR